MAKRAPSQWGSFIHYDGHKKPRENSKTGIDDAAKRVGRRRRIDLDSQMTLAVLAVKTMKKVRTFANTHWSGLGYDFIWTKKSEAVAQKLGIKGVVAGKPANKNVHKLPWELVSTLVSKDGHYPINSMGSQVAYAAKREVDVEHEPKDVPTVEEFKRIFRVARNSYGPNWRKHYLVKRLWNLPGAAQCLENARAADPEVYLMAINVKADEVHSLPSYVTHYRLGKG